MRASVLHSKRPSSDAGPASFFSKQFQEDVILPLSSNSALSTIIFSAQKMDLIKTLDPTCYNKQEDEETDSPISAHIGAWKRNFQFF